MAKVLIDIDDKFIDWTGWAREQLRQGGIPTEVVAEVDAAPEASSDPWEAPGTTPADAPQDPWSAAPAATSAPPASSAPQTGTSTGQPATPPRSGAYSADGKTHEFGLQGAPPCTHGQPAVRVTGRKQDGKPWKQWRCALSSTARWKDKCEFTSWA